MEYIPIVDKKIANASTNQKSWITNFYAKLIKKYPIINDIDRAVLLKIF